MKSIVVGTAGHIDHGKTALVRALTGIDTDRLEEEKRRGISIDLGFAHMNLTAQLRVALVDVPGHERFIKNMLAGAAGIDAVLLVVAADESIKPQTREHFDICRLLRIPRGVVVLTKADLVDTDIIDLVRLEVEEFSAGTFLEGAPIVAVSSTTGAGLAELRSALNAVLADLPSKDASQHFRMPVDRAFVMQGFGTVVTGTIIGGTVSVEQEIEVFPMASRLRVRNIQVHGAPVQRAAAGERAALNLAGDGVEELRRGVVLAEPSSFRASSRVDCLLELLTTAKPLKNRAPVHFHTGTSEVLAEVRTLDGAAAIPPGASASVRLVLREPVLLATGDRFILRMFSPVTTIAGGEVLDAHPPVGIRAAMARERLVQLSRAGVGERIALLVRESAYGLSVDELVIRMGLRADVVLESVPAAVLLLKAPKPWLLDREWISRTTGRWKSQLAEFHTANPLKPGIPREEHRSRELPDAPASMYDAVLAQEKGIVLTGDVLHLSSHRLALQQDEEEALARIENAFLQAGLATPGLSSVLASSGVDEARARSLLQILLKRQRLTRVGEDMIFHPIVIDELRKLLSRHRGTRFGVGEFKEWTGVSRKYAIPLLEFLDRQRVTRREGDVRLVL